MLVYKLFFYKVLLFCCYRRLTIAVRVSEKNECSGDMPVYEVRLESAFFDGFIVLQALTAHSPVLSRLSERCFSSLTLHLTCITLVNCCHLHLLLMNFFTNSPTKRTERIYQANNIWIAEDMLLYCNIFLLFSFLYSIAHMCSVSLTLPLLLWKKMRLLIFAICW